MTVNSCPYSYSELFQHCVAIQENIFILGLQPIPGDPKDNGVAVMLDDRTFCFVIQHGRHVVVFLDLQGLVANQE